MLDRPNICQGQSRFAIRVVSRGRTQMQALDFASHMVLFVRGGVCARSDASSAVPRPWARRPSSSLLHSEILEPMLAPIFISRAQTAFRSTPDFRTPGEPPWPRPQTPKPRSVLAVPLQQNNPQLAKAEGQKFRTDTLLLIHLPFLPCNMFSGKEGSAPDLQPCPLGVNHVDRDGC